MVLNDKQTQRHAQGDVICFSPFYTLTQKKMVRKTSSRCNKLPHAKPKA